LSPCWKKTDKQSLVDSYNGEYSLLVFKCQIKLSAVNASNEFLEIFPKLAGDRFSMAPSCTKLPCPSAVLPSELQRTTKKPQQNFSRGKTSLRNLNNMSEIDILHWLI
jgi:hypothetical protein